MRSLRNLMTLSLTTTLLLCATEAAAKPKSAPPTTTAAQPKAQTAQATPAATPPTGNESAIEEARTRYNRGIELYNDGDYKLALIEFQRSYDLAPNWRILYNIGQVLFQLNNYSAALANLEKYLRDGGTQVPESRAKDVERDIESLKARTAYLAITVNVEGADVSIDDNFVGKSPLAKELMIDAGNRRVTVTKAGYRPQAANVVIAGKERKVVNLDLAVEQPNVVYTPAAGSSSPSYLWVGWATTGALAAGAVVTGVLALGAKHDLDRLRSQRDVTRQELDDKQSSMKTLGIATDVLTGAAIIVGGVSLYFTIKGPSKKETAQTTNVRLGAGPGRLLLDGTF